MTLADTSQDWKFWYTIVVLVLAVVPLTCTALTTEPLKEAGVNRWLIYAWIILGCTFVVTASGLGIGAILVGPIGPAFISLFSSLACITLGAGMIMLYRGMPQEQSLEEKLAVILAGNLAFFGTDDSYDLRNPANRAGGTTWAYIHKSKEEAQKTVLILNKILTSWDIDDYITTIYEEADVGAYEEHYLKDWQSVNPNFDCTPYHRDDLKLVPLRPLFIIRIVHIGVVA